MGSEIRIGTVGQCWRYPVKSMQGSTVPALRIGTHGAAGDRAHALVDVASDTVLSAKAVPELLWARAGTSAIDLPDGDRVALDDPDRDARLSDWLGRSVRLLTLEQSGVPPRADLSYEMTFDPPDDEAEYVSIPLPEHGFVDLAPVHLVAAATLRGCAAVRPDLDWDVRRFRPNLVLDTEGESFVEDGWVGAALRIGERCVLSVRQPTVRCAMPLRAQPGGTSGEPALERSVELFAAMNQLHEAFPNHLGAYAEVETHGVVAEGDPVVLVGDT